MYSMSIYIMDNISRSVGVYLICKDFQHKFMCLMHSLEQRKVTDGQGGLVCCGSWGCKELDATERLN